MSCSNVLAQVREALRVAATPFFLLDSAVKLLHETSQKVVSFALTDTLQTLCFGTSRFPKEVLPLYFDLILADNQGNWSRILAASNLYM